METNVQLKLRRGEIKDLKIKHYSIIAVLTILLFAFSYFLNYDHNKIQELTSNIAAGAYSGSTIIHNAPLSCDGSEQRVTTPKL